MTLKKVLLFGACMFCLSIAFVSVMDLQLKEAMMWLAAFCYAAKDLV